MHMAARYGSAAAKVALALFLVVGASARADSVLIPTPRIVIYPGDLIQSDMLDDIAADPTGPGGPFILNRVELMGKVSRRTLLPGRAIPAQAIDSPRAVRNGSVVKMIYRDGGLVIETTGMALQDGAVGERIRVRNVDSGVSVDGRVQADGTIMVSG